LSSILGAANKAISSGNGEGELESSRAIVEGSNCQLGSLAFFLDDSDASLDSTVSLTDSGSGRRRRDRRSLGDKKEALRKLSNAAKREALDGDTCRVTVVCELKWARNGLSWDETGDGIEKKFTLAFIGKVLDGLFEKSVIDKEKTKEFTGGRGAGGGA
jgi:hypothetical protein